jgi:hypothetical protein
MILKYTSNLANAGMLIILTALCNNGVISDLASWIPTSCCETIRAGALEQLKQQLQDAERVDLAMTEAGVTFEAIRVILRTLVPQRGWKAGINKIVSARKDTVAVMQQLLPIWETPASEGHFISAARLLQLMLTFYVAQIKDR